MIVTNKTVLVLGATGRQGGATARHLLKRGWHVRALVRDPNKAAAQFLHQAGVEIVHGDYENLATLRLVMQDVYGVFSVQAFSLDASLDEACQGKQIAETAKAASVQHFVYTSVQNAENLAKAGGDARKWEIEQHILSLGLPATILRPPFFMETLLAARTDVPNGVLGDTFTIGVSPEVPMGLIAVDDIGVFATLAFEHPDQYLGKTIEIAGDILTPTQIADAMSRASGRSIPYVQVPLEALRQQSTEIANAVEYLNKSGYTTDLAALREKHPGLMTLSTWLTKEGKTQLAIRD